MIQSLEIATKSFEPEYIRLASKQILAGVSPHWKVHEVCFPSRTKKFTLLRSPHIDKKSREQFQMCTQKKTLFLTWSSNFAQNPREIQILLENLKQIPFLGVQVQIQILSQTSL